ncbi:MAG: hypothetical protein ABIX01_22180 [Chitinophagaceae bacterium]
MTIFLSILYTLLAIHYWLVVRYVFKAVFGHVYPYSFLKLLFVAFVPFIGYWQTMKRDAIAG